MTIRTWKQFGFGAGTQAAGNLINTGTNMLNSWFNYQLNEKAANNADARQRAMYNDLYSPNARLQQYRDAGISPSLAFSQGGAGGAGGASAPQGAGAAGPSVMGGKLDPAQLATIQNINADTNLKNAQQKLLGEQTIQQHWQNFITENIAGTTIRMQHAQLQSLIAQTNYTLALTEGQEFTNEFNKENREKLIQELDYKLENLLMDVWLKHTEGEKNYAQARNFMEQIQWYIGDIKAKNRANEINKQNADTQKQWCQDQAKNLVEHLKIDKLLAMVDVVELGLKETATKTERLKVWLDFIADFIRSGVILGRGFTPN